jgi:hypothetical protein
MEKENTGCFNCAARKATELNPLTFLIEGSGSMGTVLRPVLGSLADLHENAVNFLVSILTHESPVRLAKSRLAEKEGYGSFERLLGNGEFKNALKLADFSGPVVFVVDQDSYGMADMEEIVSPQLDKNTAATLDFVIIYKDGANETDAYAQQLAKKYPNRVAIYSLPYSVPMNESLLQTSLQVAYKKIILDRCMPKASPQKQPQP